MPKPSDIWSQFVDQIDRVRAACMVTGSNALVGLVLGALLGFAVAVVTNRFRLIAELVNPLAVQLGTVVCSCRTVREVVPVGSPPPVW